ncbi:MAG TPA: helix-turn-helix transcriptional regulator [Gemmatimonadaceae bacterium]|nr:helix-turn-helix transcriptional regulator [Gemmatimonadaceae bacterium]
MKRGRDVEEHLPMSSASFHILLALAGGAQHGYSIMREIRESTDGRIRVAPATLYRLIGGLLRSELIEEFEPGDPSYEDERRKYYRLTTFGRRVLTEETKRLVATVELARERRIIPRLS